MLTPALPCFSAVFGAGFQGAKIFKTKCAQCHTYAKVSAPRGCAERVGPHRNVEARRLAPPQGGSPVPHGQRRSFSGSPGVRRWLFGEDGRGRG